MRSIRAGYEWRSTIESVRGRIRSREKEAIYLKCGGTADVNPAFPVQTKCRETFAMNDVSQFATAMLALFFVGALLVTGQLYIEQRAQRDVVYATSHLLRP
jgi:hypothetical protein